MPAQLSVFDIPPPLVLLDGGLANRGPFKLPDGRVVYWRSLATYRDVSGDPTQAQGTFADFDPELFSTVDRAGNPFYSFHTLWVQGGLWIGSVFRDRPDEGWQIRVCGAGEALWGGDTFEQAFNVLLRKEAEKIESDRLWREEHGVKR